MLAFQLLLSDSTKRRYISNNHGLESLIDNDSFLFHSFLKSSMNVNQNDSRIVHQFPTDLDKIVELVHSTKVALNYANYFTFQQLHDKAMPWYRRSLQLNSNCTTSLFYVGFNAHQMGDFVTSISHFSKIVNMDHLNYEGWFHLGLSYQHSGNVELSSSCYEQCISLYPNHEKSRINLASLHHQYGSLDKAFKHYEILLESYESIKSSTSNGDNKLIIVMSPEYNMVVLNYGVALLQNGSHEKVV